MARASMPGVGSLKHACEIVNIIIMPYEKTIAGMTAHAGLSGPCGRSAKWQEVRSQVEKDVWRTDRAQPFYQAENYIGLRRTQGYALVRSILRHVQAPRPTAECFMPRLRYLTAFIDV